jgi:predicted enzyme related to lactoylglutathione lyase
MPVGQRRAVCRVRLVACAVFRLLVSGRVASGIARTVPGMAIARFPSIVIDCPDPSALAKFYGAMLGWKVDASSKWADVRAEHGQCISFQQVEGYKPPEWPSQDVPQQMHLDVIVDDLDIAEAAVLDIGASKHEHQPGTTFRVFLDPAGHPFCLCVD